MFFDIFDNDKGCIVALVVVVFAVVVAVVLLLVAAVVVVVEVDEFGVRDYHVLHVMQMIYRKLHTTIIKFTIMIQ